MSDRPSRQFCRPSSEPVRIVVLAIVAPLLAAEVASAASVTRGTDPANPATAASITGFATFGDDMAGMTVTATFNNGTSQSVAWQATSATAGQAAGTGWSVSENGDTFGGDWVLTNVNALPITSLLFDGTTGRTVFDVNPGTPDTPNSAGGLPFTVVGTNLYDLNVLYLNPLGVGGSPPVGDLWARMRVSFVSPAGAFAAGSALAFETDTDSATSDVIVPEPAAAAGLVVIAGTGLAARRRRRRAR